MNNNHSCIKIEIRPTDWVMGSTSKIVFKAVATDWSKHLDFFERQMLADGDSDDCVIFTQQESFDAQMDVLWPTFPLNTQQELVSMGYYDTGNDGNLHFHSSPRFSGILTGNGQNGNPLHAPWDVARNFGVLPWKDLPVTAGMTVAEYYDKTQITQAMYEKAAAFLALIGGKNAIQYHWVADGKENMAAMIAALPQAPLCLGLPVGEDWNVEMPAIIPPGPPAHSVLAYAVNAGAVSVLDHYVPFDKVLQSGYPIPYALQGVVAPIFAQVASEANSAIPAAPVLPASPTVTQEVSWLDSVKQWLTLIYDTIQGRNLTSDSPTMTFLQGKKTYILGVCGILFAVFAFVTGHIDSNTAITLLFGSLASMGLRNGMTNTVEKFLQLAPDETLPPAAGSTS